MWLLRVVVVAMGVNLDVVAMGVNLDVVAKGCCGCYG